MFFVDRDEELKVLEDEFARLGKQASLAVIYGRRRIGKTELIKRFLSGRPHIYFLATLQSREEVVAGMSMKAAEFFGDRATAENPHTTWSGFLGYLARELKQFDKPFVIVFDEFTYLVQQDAAVPSILQQYWDEHFKNMPVMVILCGSYVGMMEKEVLAYRSPLYGRRTRQLFVVDIGIGHIREFFPHYSKEDLVELYAVLGGVPYYLLKFDPSKKVRENILVNFLEKDKPLFNDGLVLLREELKEPRNYLSILKAISFGKVSQKEIADHAHLEPALVGKYLDVLRGMKVVSRIVPVTEKNPEKSRRGIYAIKDRYYNFWLRFVYPYADYVEEGRSGELMKNMIAPALGSFVGMAFEGIARNALLRLNAQNKLPCYFEKIGQWWHRDVEIDVVCLNAKTKDMLVGEVKWADLGEKEVASIAARLRNSAKEILWHNDLRKEHYCIIARKIKAKPEPGLILLELDDLL